jgi:two-component system, chemotaxis family, protein-glutamate methylesterase/glutaminase
MTTDFRIVSLCGSAGALSAYMKIIHAVPTDSGMAFIVLTHRRMEYPCWLVQILSNQTRMHVEEIVDGTILQPNSVYVIPAGKDLTTDGEVFWLAPASKIKGWPNTFDLFLNSMAQNALGRAVTVILSGLAKDGSAALEMLKTSGGMNYAQANASSQSMPRSAIATGNIDFVGSPEEIVAAICRLPPLVDTLRRLDAKGMALRTIARELQASKPSARDNLSVVRDLLLSSRALVEDGRTLIRESQESIRTTEIAICKSRELLRIPPQEVQ